MAKATSEAIIIGVDVRKEASEAARRAGADHVVDGTSENVVDGSEKLNQW